MREINSRSRIGIVFEQRLVRSVVFSSLVLVNWDRLNFFDPDASRPANFIDLTLPGERARDSPEETSARAGAPKRGARARALI